MIEVKNLTFSYGKDKQVLHGLNLTVKYHCLDRILLQHIRRIFFRR